jgi:hypothetical protein
MYYYSKRRIDLGEVYSRLRGGSSQRDIGRELGCSRTAVATAVHRLGRQAMASQVRLLCELGAPRRMSFDGLLSAVCSRDYPSQITTLGDSERELILAITHCVSERGGRRTAQQERRIARKRAVWRPARGALTESIALLVNELARYASPVTGVHLDTDCHPIYAQVLARDVALGWYHRHRLLSVRRTPGSASRTVGNPLFFMNYVDRMMRHRMKEHTRESIALARSATAQMHRMWIFAWDHNTRQPARVAANDGRSRAERAGLSLRLLTRLHREFTTRRQSLRRVPMPESMRRVWTGVLDSPPVRWRVGQKSIRPQVPAFALLDLRLAHPQAQ